MASRRKGPGNGTHIYVKCSNGKRRTIRLGELNPAEAKEAQRRLTTLEECYVESIEIDSITLAWIDTLPTTVRQRVHKTGLIGKTGPPIHRQNMSFTRLVDLWIATLDVAPQTVDNYRRVADHLIAHFGPETSLPAVTPAAADAWQSAYQTEGRGRASGSRATGTARRIIEFAVRLRWIDSNPFSHLKRHGEWNEERCWYIEPRLVKAIVQECQDAELRAMIALSRWATFRGPSEFQHLKWADIDFARDDIRITSPKTARYQGGSSRLAPLDETCQEVLNQLWEAAPEGELVFQRLGRHESSGLSQRMDPICRRLGVILWPKPWINMRASCETDWQQAGKSIFHTASWMGHSPEVALRHYNRIVKDRVADLPVEPSSDSSGRAPERAANPKRSAKRSTQASSR